MSITLKRNANIVNLTRKAGFSIIVKKLNLTKLTINTTVMREKCTHFSNKVK